MIVALLIDVTLSVDSDDFVLQTKSVLQQRWPTIDDDFRVPMLIKVCG